MAPTATADLSSPVKSFPDIPPFPDTVPTAPLVCISLRKLVDGDYAEEERLWEACLNLGFFYLDMRMGGSGSVQLDGVKENNVDGDAVLREADGLFTLMKALFELPMEGKQPFDLKEKGIYFGYKGLGTGIIDKAGTKDRNEYWNVSKNDMLELSPPQPNPSLMELARPLFSSYMTHAHAIITLILRLLNTRLGLPPGKLESMHRLRGLAGDQVRLIHSPPQPADDRTLSNGEHTDFGSVTILFNRIGGLQVRLPPHLKPNPPTNGDVNGSVLGKVRLNQEGLPVTKAEEEEWAYVHPLPNHAIVNLGDAMAKFSAGILRSNIHRVMSPPGAQAGITRYSLVYFSRPEDDVLLKPLRDNSEMVARVLKETGRDNVVEEGFSSKEWVHRMALGRRGIGKWLYSNSNMASTKGY